MDGGAGPSGISDRERRAAVRASAILTGDTEHSDEQREPSDTGRAPSESTESETNSEAVGAYHYNEIHAVDKDFLNRISVAVGMNSKSVEEIWNVRSKNYMDLLNRVGFARYFMHLGGTFLIQDLHEDNFVNIEMESHQRQAYDALRQIHDNLWNQENCPDLILMSEENGRLVPITIEITFHWGLNPDKIYAEKKIKNYAVVIVFHISGDIVKLEGDVLPLAQHMAGIGDTNFIARVEKGATDMLRRLLIILTPGEADDIRFGTGAVQDISIEPFNEDFERMKFDALTVPQMTQKLKNIFEAQEVRRTPMTLPTKRIQATSAEYPHMWYPFFNSGVCVTEFRDLFFLNVEDMFREGNDGLHLFKDTRTKVDCLKNLWNVVLKTANFEDFGNTFVAVDPGMDPTDEMGRRKNRFHELFGEGFHETQTNARADILGDVGRTQLNKPIFPLKTGGAIDRPSAIPMITDVYWRRLVSGGYKVPDPLISDHLRKRAPEEVKIFEAMWAEIMSRKYGHVINDLASTGIFFAKDAARHIVKKNETMKVEEKKMLGRDDNVVKDDMANFMQNFVIESIKHDVIKYQKLQGGKMLKCRMHKFELSDKYKLYKQGARYMVQGLSIIKNSSLTFGKDVSSTNFISIIFEKDIGAAELNSGYTWFFTSEPSLFIGFKQISIVDMKVAQAILMRHYLPGKIAYMTDAWARTIPGQIATLDGFKDFQRKYRGVLESLHAVFAFKVHAGATIDRKIQGAVGPLELLNKLVTRTSEEEVPESYKPEELCEKVLDMVTTGPTKLLYGTYMYLGFKKKIPFNRDEKNEPDFIKQRDGPHGDSKIVRLWRKQGILRENEEINQPRQVFMDKTRKQVADMMVDGLGLSIADLLGRIVNTGKYNELDDELRVLGDFFKVKIKVNNFTDKPTKEPITVDCFDMETRETFSFSADEVEDLRRSEAINLEKKRVIPDIVKPPITTGEILDGLLDDTDMLSSDEELYEEKEEEYIPLVAQKETTDYPVIEVEAYYDKGDEEFYDENYGSSAT